MSTNHYYKFNIIAVIFSAFMIGFASMLGQIVLMREMVVVFYGNELSLGVILASWLFWVAFGSSVLGRFSDKIKSKLNILIICHFLTFLILPLSIFVTRNIRNIIGTSPGELISFRPILLSSFFVLMPICALIGFTFALTCRVLSDTKGSSAISVGQVYILEAVGASIGGLLANFALIGIFNSYQIVFFVGTLNLCCALLLLISKKKSKYALTAIALIFLAFITASWLLSGKLHRVTAKLQWKELQLENNQISLEYNKNSIYGNLVVTKMFEQYNFYENGLLMFSTKDILSSEESVHFAMLEHPEPKNILLIGGGVNGSLEQILKYNVKHVDYVELDPLIINVAKRYLSKSEQKPLNDKRVKIHLTDARRFIKSFQDSESRTGYDVVIVNLPEPYTALLNRFYSLEFFDEVNKVLANRGIISLSTSSSENYLSHEQREFLRSIYATLEKVFEDVKVLPGGQNFFIAQKINDTKKPDITYNSNILAKRLKERELDTKYIREYYLTYRLSPDRVDYIKEVLAETSENRKIKLNHDFRPIGYYYDMVLWGTQFTQISQKAFLPKFVKLISRLNFWHILVFIFFLFILFLLIHLIVKKTVRFPVILSIGTTGFSEMLFQVVVILSFQVLYGYVYHKLSLILAAFMIGLVGGSWLINRKMDTLRRPVQAYIYTQISICVYPLILLSVLFMAKSSIILHLATPFALLPIIAGFIGGIQFPLANKICLESFSEEKKGIGRLAGLIYGIDLLGSCMGALLASAILVPILGVFQTCLLVAFLNTTVLILIAVSKILHK